VQGRRKNAIRFFEMNLMPLNPRAAVLTKPEDALQMDGMNDFHKNAQMTQKHSAFVLFVPLCSSLTLSSNEVVSQDFSKSFTLILMKTVPGRSNGGSIRQRGSVQGNE
jgi:hypothetical protein